MTSFVHTPHSFHHAGVARAEKAAETLRDASRQFDGPRGTATLLLAAVVAALVVAANQVIDTWSDGHLLAAWIGLWTVAFAAWPCWPPRSAVPRWACAPAWPRGTAPVAKPPRTASCGAWP